MDLTLETRDADGVTIVAVGGEIDVYTAPKLRDRITGLAKVFTIHESAESATAAG